jgi:isopentenyl-diphosphate delta-isomerase
MRENENRETRRDANQDRISPRSIRPDAANQSEMRGLDRGNLRSHGFRFHRSNRPSLQNVLISPPLRVPTASPARSRRPRSDLDDELIVVDARNRAIGRAGKREAHEEGLLHRAFSICLVDRAGQMLLQQRHPAKYHSGGLWANSCCGHPRPGERTLPAARRRLFEELGAKAPLHFGFTTHYRATFPNGLSENEIVAVYFGLTPPTLSLNPREVSAVTAMSLRALRADIRRRPGIYAIWLQHYVLHHFELIGAGIDAVLKK